MAIEFEMDKWKGFRKALESEEDRQAFEELMDMCRSYALAGSNATNPIVFEPMLIPIALFLQRKTSELEKKLNAIYQQAQARNG